MTFVADLHLHSKYSRAVSPNMILPEMARWARLKGLDIISASDFTHPLWFRELKSQLSEDTQGLYKLKSIDYGLRTTAVDSSQKAESQKEVLFLLSTELSSIYKQGDKLRRIHNLIFAPSLETVEKITKEFTRRAFNLMADGRPIFGLSSENLVELLLGIDENIMLIPCHVWTPHFGIYGSASGFDSLEEAFGKYAKNIYAVETGLSSDPEMNWVMPELNSRSILSFSDAHSGPKMGREATVFTLRKNAEVAHKNFRVHNADKLSLKNKKVDGANAHSENFESSPHFEISYKDITDAIKRDKKGKLEIQYTIEFYPEEGKYHYSGHRNCKVIRGPEELRKDGNICPVCKRKLTEGVLYRVQELSKGAVIESEAKISPSGIKWYTDKGKNHPPYVKLVPLNEIIAESYSATVLSQKVKDAFENICHEFGSEIEVLLKTPISEISKHSGEKVAEGVRKVREGNIEIDPGYDGEYGKVKIWNEEEESQGAEAFSAMNDESQLGLKF